MHFGRTATLRTVQSQAAVRSGVAAHSVRAAGVLLAPSALLLLGSVIGYLGTLDLRVAQERLIGVALAAVLAAAAVYAFSRTQPLLAMAVLALLGGLWVSAATGPEVFRGPVGAILTPLFRPLFGLVRVTDSVDIANTRFIIGYNGLADLCLVAIFSAGAVLLERTGRALRLAL